MPLAQRSSVVSVLFTLVKHGVTYLFSLAALSAWSFSVTL
jgi:hypothetical protein